MMRRIGAPTIALALLLVGCSTGGPAYATVFDLASAIGCQDFKNDTQQMFFVKDGGDCSFDAGTVQIYTYASNDARDAWIEAAQNIGGRNYAAGDEFAIAGDDAAVVKAAADKTGAKVVD